MQGWGKVRERLRQGQGMVMAIHACTASRITAYRDKGNGNKHYRIRDNATLKMDFPHDTNKPTILLFKQNLSEIEMVEKT